MKITQQQEHELISVMQMIQSGQEINLNLAYNLLGTLNLKKLFFDYFKLDKYIELIYRDPHKYMEDGFTENFKQNVSEDDFIEICKDLFLVQSESNSISFEIANSTIFSLCSKLKYYAVIDTVVICEIEGVEQVKDIYPPTVKNFHFRDLPNLSSIPNSITSERSLEYLSIRSCPNVNDLSFLQNARIKYLSIIDSPVNQFPKEINSIKVLKRLSLTETKIESIAEFIPPPTLVKLRLDKSPVREIPVHISDFIKSSGLIEINLSSTKIKSIPNTSRNESPFKNRVINELYLSSMDEHFDWDKLFSQTRQATQVQELDARDNYFQTFDGHNFPRLLLLSIDGNKRLSKVNNIAMHRKINLRGCNLSQFPYYLLSEKLDIINLAENRISRVNRAKIKSIRDQIKGFVYLNISANPIRDLSFLKQLDCLRRLDIDNYPFDFKLDGSFIENTLSICRFKLRKNTITEIDASAILEKIKFLDPHEKCVNFDLSDSIVSNEIIYNLYVYLKDNAHDSIFRTQHDIRLCKEHFAATGKCRLKPNPKITIFVSKAVEAYVNNKLSENSN